MWAAMCGSTAIYPSPAFSRLGIQVRTPQRQLSVLSLLIPAVPHYQPETAAQIFKRVMLNQDVATGKVSTTSDYSSVGRDTAWSTDTLPTLGPAKCYLWDVLETCTQAEGAILLSGNAIVQDYVLVGVGNGTTNSTSEL